MNKDQSPAHELVAGGAVVGVIIGIVVATLLTPIESSYAMPILKGSVCGGSVGVLVAYLYSLVRGREW